MFRCFFPMPFVFGLFQSRCQNRLIRRRLTWGGGRMLPAKKLKTTPTPNKNGSYGMKVGVRTPYFGGSYPICSVNIPVFTEGPRDVDAIRPLILWRVLGACFFANTRGGGLSKLFSKRPICTSASQWR